MKKCTISLLYIFLFVCGSIFAQTGFVVGERVISLGGNASWNTAETRTGITEAADVRSNSVLILSSVSGHGYSAASGVPGTGVPGNFLNENALDMSVSFDEIEPSLFRDSTGRYRIISPVNLDRVDRGFARSGAGAASFGSADGPVIIEPQNRNALFAQGNQIGDFTIEFWLYPLNLENGERIFSWVSHNGNTQRIQCITTRNRLQWSFINFFTSTAGTTYINLEFSGNTPIIPKTWTHHLIRFDSKTGMVEYLVDGISEAIVYATVNGRENREVFLPVAGTGGAFLLGERYSGLMDELKIHSVFAGRSSIQRYPVSGGRMETRTIDLGENLSNILRVDVKGGRITNRTPGFGSGNSVINEYRENGVFRFSDESQLNFFIRSSENPWLLNNNPWVRFVPGESITGITGRYVQVAADFYPSSDGESSPYLEQLNIVFLPGESPLPPRNVTAAAFDGGVHLRWRHSPNTNSGYFVYYSTVRGELFGDDAIQGVSPIDVGMTDGIVINGLKNGTLYYFRVAGYEYVPGSSIKTGDFSAEVTARPLAGYR